MRLLAGQLSIFQRLGPVAGLAVVMRQVGGARGAGRGLAAALCLQDIGHEPVIDHALAFEQGGVDGLARQGVAKLKGLGRGGGDEAIIHQRAQMVK